MNKLKNNLRLILSDKYINILMSLFIAFILYQIVYRFVAYSNSSDILLILLNGVLAYAYIYFVMCMFFANHVTARFKRTQYSELMSVNTFSNGYVTYAATLIGLNAVISLVIIALSVGVSANVYAFTTQYMWYLIRILVLYFLLPGVLANLIGMVLAVFNKKIFAYIIMCVIAFFLSPSTVEKFNERPNFASNAIVNLLNILPRDLNTLKSEVILYSIDFDEWSRVAILIAIMYLLFVNIYTKNKKLVPNSIGVVLLVSMLLIYNQDYSKVGEMKCQGSGGYYANLERVTKEQNFDILEYDMDIKLRNDLKVDCTMTLSDTSLEEYAFTLYHTFKVSNVCDQAGNKLRYVQDKDWVKVYSDGNKLEKIKITYSGITDNYYLGRDAVYLSGTFPYYPYAGTHNIYDYVSLGKVNLPPINTGDPEIDEKINAERANAERKKLQFGIYYTGKKAKFSVDIDALIKIYTNLDSKDYNSFEGEAENCLLMGGFLKEMVVDDVTFVYPYLSTMNTEEMLRLFIKECETIEKDYDTDYTVHGKTVFIHKYSFREVNGISTYNDDYMEVYGSVGSTQYKEFLKKKQEEKKE